MNLSLVRQRLYFSFLLEAVKWFITQRRKSNGLSRFFGDIDLLWFQEWKNWLLENNLWQRKYNLFITRIKRWGFSPRPQRSENCRVVNLFVNFSEKAKQVVIMFLRLMHNYLHSDSLRETKSVNLNFLLFIIHIMKLLSKPLVYFFGFSVLILNEFLWGWITPNKRKWTFSKKRSFWPL